MFFVSNTSGEWVPQIIYNPPSIRGQQEPVVQEPPYRDPFNHVWCSFDYYQFWDCWVSGSLAMNQTGYTKEDSTWIHEIGWICILKHGPEWKGLLGRPPYYSPSGHKLVSCTLVLGRTTFFHLFARWGMVLVGLDLVYLTMQKIHYRYPPLRTLWHFKTSIKGTIQVFFWIMRICKTMQ